MNDVVTQIETNTKTMMILFDERKEMILKLIAMVEELQPIVVKQQAVIQILTAEIVRLRAHAPGKKIRSKQRSSQVLTGTIEHQDEIESCCEGRCVLMSAAYDATNGVDSLCNTGDTQEVVVYHFFDFMVHKRAPDLSNQSTHPKNMSKKAKTFDTS